MKNIIKFLGRKVPPLPRLDQSLPGTGLQSELPAAADVVRLIEFYQRVGTLPFDKFDEESVYDIRQAFEEGRVNDALDLIDMIVESGEEGPYHEEAPVHGVRIGRYGGSAPHVARPALRLVGDPVHAETLSPGLILHGDATPDWKVRCGEFFVAPGGEAEIELGLKGELVLVVLTGSITVQDADGDVIETVASLEEGSAVRQIVYCRARNAHRSMLVRIVASGGTAARGIWCDSSRSRLSPGDRQHDPENQDVFFVQSFHDVELVAGGVERFCSQAVAIRDREDYAHYDSVKRGELARFQFRSAGMSRHECWTLDGWEEMTSIVGITAGASTGKPRRTLSQRTFARHLGIELFVVLDGIAWVAVREDSPPGGSEKMTCKLAGSPALVMPLAVSDGGHDVMLLDSSRCHTVWTTPGSDARFVHAAFYDPLNIRPVRVRDDDSRDGKAGDANGDWQDRCGSAASARAQRPQEAAGMNVRVRLGPQCLTVARAE